VASDILEPFKTHQNKTSSSESWRRCNHLLQVARALVNKKHKCRVQVEWRHFLRHAVDKSYLQPSLWTKFTRCCRIWKLAPLQVMTMFIRSSWRTWVLEHKPGRHTFPRIIIANAIPNIWRKTEIIAIEKPGKDPRLAEPLSLLSTCYKLLECLVLHRISPEVKKLLSPEQSGFWRNRSTCEQVAALTTHIENGFQQQLKTCAVFLDLTAAYDTVWHTGLLC